MKIIERMNHYKVPGASVTYFENAKIMWNKCFGTLERDSDRTVNENSIFHACSISKMVTALCVLRLAEDGLIDLNKNVNEYLGSWKIPDNEFTIEKKITLRNLLSHQAGFYDIEGSFEPYKLADNIPEPIDILKGRTVYHPEEVHAKYVPESDFSYSDAGYCVIAQVLKDTFGETVSQIAKRILFDPLGLQSTFFWEIGMDLSGRFNLSDCTAGHDSNGEIVEGTRAFYPNIEGAALWTTPKDLARIVIDIIKAYHGMDSLILKPDMARFMLSPNGCTESAGMGVFLQNDERGEPYFFSQGWGVGMQCKLRAYYKKQNGVVVMTNSEPGMEQDKALIGEIIECACRNHVLE
jgi:CubicO group peptidase (beta-lactamase class C family)